MMSSLVSCESRCDNPFDMITTSEECQYLDTVVVRHVAEIVIVRRRLKIERDV